MFPAGRHDEAAARTRGAALQDRLVWQAAVACCWPTPTTGRQRLDTVDGLLEHLVSGAAAPARANRCRPAEP